MKYPFSVALSLQDLSILATPNSNQRNGINLICDIGKATGKLIAEDENVRLVSIKDCSWQWVSGFMPCVKLNFSLVQPSSDSGDVLRASFIGQLVLQLFLNSDRPIKLLQFTVVPVSLYVFEGQCEECHVTQCEGCHVTQCEECHVTQCEGCHVTQCEGCHVTSVRDVM